MALFVTCENCRKQLRAKGSIDNNTIKCTYCGHLQYVPPPDCGPSSEQKELVGQALMTAGGASPAAAPWANGDCSFLEEPQPTHSEIPAFAETERSATVESKPRPASSEVPPRGPGFRDYFYWILLLAFIPLGFSLFQTKSDLKERFERTEHNNPKVLERWHGREDPSLDDLVNEFPDHRVEGAFLPRDTEWHWAFAGLSAIGFLVLIVLLFPNWSTNPRDLFLIGLFTGTIGIILLLAVQFLAMFTQGLWIRGGGALTLIFYILKFIGYSYRSAMDPDSSFILSFLGFTLGVGLCEELCKALPLLWYYRGSDRMSWRGACRWGLASGVGFGVAEGISYCSDFYNGIQTADIYIVRFVSCVCLHAVWSATAGVTLYKCQSMFQGNLAWYEYGLPLLRVLVIPMVLHGLYDTLLKMEINEFALAVAVISFAWFAWQIESEREGENALLIAARA